MPILIKGSSADQKSEGGFTLIECILAVAILAMLLGSIVALQSSIISTTQISSDKMRAVWAMRSAMAQVDYLLEISGQDSIPETSTFPWAGDPNFTITVTRKDLKEVKPSQFLISALRVNNLVSPTGDSSLDVEKMLAPVASLLDAGSSLAGGMQDLSNTSGNPKSVSAQSDYSNVVVKVEWKDASQVRSLSSGIFLIETKNLQQLQKSKPTSPGGDKPGGSTSPGGGTGTPVSTPPPSSWRGFVRVPQYICKN